MGRRSAKRVLPSTDSAPEPPAAKRAKPAGPPDSPFLAQWLWKREAKSDDERFNQPYEYPLEEDGGTLVVQQRPFSSEGFASTVWDSAIVLGKLLERRPELARGRSAVELGAGCGLLSLVLSHLGARVTVTDLECNLPLLRDNMASNGSSAQVHALSWGAANARQVRRETNGGLPFDVVVSSDIMYIPDAVPALVATLKELSGESTDVYLAYGRNRTAEDAFLLAASRAGFTATPLEAEELHEVYNCLDVTVLKLKLLTS